MPETIESSPQYQATTTSQDGRNVMPVMQSESFFFLEDGNFTQTDAQKFGAISESEFRTTAKISFTGDKDVYTICKGTVFIQPNTSDENKVNVILKPFKQPIPGIAIKYFIYRGLNKQDFVDGNNLVAGSAESGSAFVQYIHQDFNTFNADNPEATFLASYIGFPENPADQDENSLIDLYFYKITSVDEETGEEDTAKAYELPLIPMGISLGMATSELGIDIVLNTGDYYIENDPNPFQLNLAYARAGESILSAPVLTDPSDLAAKYLRKLMQENAVNFIDIAAFYGMHCNGSGKLHLADGTTFTSASDVFGYMNTFYTKNTTYIYIQGQRQRSYGFYEDNYLVSNELDSKAIQIGVDTNTMQETTFGTFGWPIHEFTTSLSEPIEQTSLALQLITDNNSDAVVYVHQGTLLSNHEENFVRSTNLLQTESEDENNPIDTNYTQPLVIKIDAIFGNVISSLVSLISETRQLYVELYIDPNDTETEQESYVLKDIDDVFGLINIIPANEIVNEILLPTVIEERVQIINFPSESGINDTAAIKCQRVEDRVETFEADNYINRLTYETRTHIIKSSMNSLSANSGSKNIDGAISRSISYSGKSENYYLSDFPNIFKKKIFTYENQLETGLVLYNLNDERPTKKILGITKDEFELLEALCINSNLINTTIFFSNAFEIEEEHYTSQDPVEYSVFKIGIAGENNEGKVKVFFPIEMLKVFSLDQFVFHTSKYSKYLPYSDNKFSSYNLLPEQ